MEQQNSSENTNYPAPDEIQTKNRFSRLVAVIKKKPSKKEFAIVSGVSLGVLIMGVIGAFTLIKNNTPLNPEPTIESTYIAPPPTFTSPLTGLLTDEVSSKRPVTGIMIENSIDARPQAGLVDAGVVFEAIAEGGITRFLALFQEAQPEHIGPIRSARPYYVRWAAGFDAAYVHSGGSPEALALISGLGVKDLDHGRFGEQIASRVSNRYAPHNVYTSMARIDEVRSAQGFTTSTFTPFGRIKDDPKSQNGAEVVTPAAQLPTANNISFNISSPLYNTSYIYEPASKTYKRTLGGQPHTDERSGKQISPTVVVALITPFSIHPNGIHSVYANVGAGKVIIFQNGVIVEGTWQKSSDTASLQFVDSAGADIPLQPGQTWVTAVQDGRVSYTP